MSEGREILGDAAARLRDRNRRVRDRGRACALTVAVGAGLAIAVPAGSAAEPVRLRLGDAATGQGWMFTDRLGQCRIVTAGHNLGSEGRLISPVAIDRRGEEFPTAEARRPDPALDVGFLLARPARACPTGGLAEADVDARLARAPAAYLDLVLDRATSTIALQRRQRGMDDQGGRILLFERASDTVDLSQGLSGGAVTDGAGRPLGIATSVLADDGRLRAVRIDVIAALLDVRVLAGKPPSRGEVLGWSVPNGRSAAPDRGPDQMLDRGPPGWTVATERGFVMVEGRLAARRSLSAVLLRFGPESAGLVDDLQVQVRAGSSGGEGEWALVRRCPVAPGAADLRCAFAPTDPVAVVRLTLRTRARQISVYGLVLE